MQQIQLLTGGFAQVSDEDFERVRRRRWSAYKFDVKYVRVRESAGIKGKHRTFLHRFVFGYSKRQIRFRDGNPLNCQRSNLEEVVRVPDAVRRARFLVRCRTEHRCYWCGEAAVPGGRYCVKHGKVLQTYSRKRAKCGAWKPGGRGRPPKYR